MTQTDIADIRATAEAARKASRILATLDTGVKNLALATIERFLKERAPEIISANRTDLTRSETEGLASPLLKRLRFDDQKLVEVCAGIRGIAALPDPVGKVLSSRELDAGLNLYQVSCPIGVICMIFESRPDALVQIACLAVKSGNAVILKGGSEAKESNRLLARIIHDAGCLAGLPRGWLGLAENRAEVTELLKLHTLIDLVIPRGSNEFVQQIMRSSLIPVMGHADGICHVYVDECADAETADKIVFDSKTQYVAVCNAAETLLIHRSRAAELLPRLVAELKNKNVELFGDTASADISPEIQESGEEIYGREYLDYQMSVRIVSSLDEAIDHINTWGSHHTDAIVTTDGAAARRFMAEVDSASVLWNASTRFADGFRFGLGAEVGISTGKLHARGPVGLEGLVTYKWKLFGSGQIVADYSGPDAKKYTHTNFNAQEEPWNES